MVLACAGPALANGITDPQIIVRDGSPGVITLTNNSFNINLPNTPGCTSTQITFNGLPATDTVCTIFVDAGVILHTLTFYITPTQGLLTGAIDPGNFPNFFTTVFVDPNNTGVTFLGGNIVGPQDGLHFEFIGFQNNTGVSVGVNTPEPATLGLFLTGVGALVARRRLRRNSAAAA